MDIKELRKKKIEDLNKMLKANREELRSLRFSISSEQEKNVRKIREVKKDIAKILTILNNQKVEVPSSPEKKSSSTKASDKASENEKLKSKEKK